jgi:hypothetical protein
MICYCLAGHCVRRKNVKISKFAAILSIAMTLGMTAPSFADDKSSGVETAVDGALVVTRVGGATAAAIVGTPIAIVRETYKSYTQWTPACADKMGAKDCGPACLMVSVVTLPAAIVWGTVTGTFYGCRNGINKGFNEPFHPDSFSLGKDIEE